MSSPQKTALNAILVVATCITCLTCFTGCVFASIGAALGFGGLNGLPIYGSPLYEAVRLGDESRVKKLLEEGADPNTMSSPDSAPKPMLYWAIDQDNNIARLLLEHGADPNPVINYPVGESEHLTDLPLQRHRTLLREFIEKRKRAKSGEENE